MTSKIYVIRHGKTIFNALDKIQGVCDSPLINSGVDEIRNIGKYYAKRNWQIDKVFHSSANRTKETLKIILSELDVNIGIDECTHEPLLNKVEGIEEWNFGSWEGHAGGRDVFLELLPRVANKPSLYDMTCPEIANAFHQIDTLKVSPNWKNLRKRILTGFSGLASTLEDNQNALVVSHGMTMLALYYILTGTTLQSGSISNGGLLELSWNGSELTVDNLESSPAYIK